MQSGAYHLIIEVCHTAQVDGPTTHQIMWVTEIGCAVLDTMVTS